MTAKRQEDSPGNASRLLMAISFIIGIYVGVKLAVVAPYLKQLGFTATEYGIFASLMVASATLFTLIAGFLSDTVGSRSTMAVGGILALISPPLYYISTPTSIALAFLVDGAAGSMIWTAQNVLVSRTVREESLHLAYGDVMASSLIGHVVGNALGWAPVLASETWGLELHYAYRVTLALLILLPLSGLPLIFRVPEKRPQQPPSRPSLRVLRKNPWLLGFLAYNTVIGLGAAMSVHNIDYYFALKYHSTSAGLGTMFAVQSILMAVAAQRLPRLSGKRGLIGTFLAFTSPSIPLLILMTLTDNYVVAAGLYIVRAVLMNAGYPLLDAYIMRRVPSEDRGMASALLNLAWNVPASIGRALGGWLMDHDIELPLRITAILYTAALLGLYKLTRGNRSDS